MIAIACLRMPAGIGSIHARHAPNDPPHAPSPARTARSRSRTDLRHHRPEDHRPLDGHPPPHPRTPGVQRRGHVPMGGRGRDGERAREAAPPLLQPDRRRAQSRPGGREDGCPLMARIRSIKPELRTSLTVAEWPREVRYFWTLLWGYLDDHGRGVDNARLVLADCFPLDRDLDEDVIDKWLGLFAESGPLCRYGVNGRRYMHSVNWKEHQRPSHPTDSRIPPCPHHHALAAAHADGFANSSGSSRESLRRDSGSAREVLASTSGSS